jgi:hypothetical protein
MHNVIIPYNLPKKNAERLVAMYSYFYTRHNAYRHLFSYQIKGQNYGHLSFLFKFK